MPCPTNSDMPLGLSSEPANKPTPHLINLRTQTSRMRESHDKEVNAVPHRTNVAIVVWLFWLMGHSSWSTAERARTYSLFTVGDLVLLFRVPTLICCGSGLPIFGSKLTLQLADPIIHMRGQGLDQRRTGNESIPRVHHANGFCFFRYPSRSPCCICPDLILPV